MKALFLVYPSIKFFIQAIKKNIASPSQFCGLYAVFWTTSFFISYC
jgi:hypothetical protein